MSNRWMLRNVEAFSILYFFENHTKVREVHTFRVSTVTPYAVAGGHTTYNEAFSHRKTRLKRDSAGL